MKKGKLLIISGPSGVGKTTIVRDLLKIDGIVKSVSATTRERRHQETDGRDYYFYTKKQFQKGLEKGKFLEYAEIFSNLYGTPREPVEDAVKNGKVVILEIDVQGANSIRKLGLDHFSIFVLPPNIDELNRRLTKRHSESPQDAERRLKIANDEISQKDLYNACVVNDDVSRAVAEIKDILIKNGIL